MIKYCGFLFAWGLKTRSSTKTKGFRKAQRMGNPRGIWSQDRWLVVSKPVEIPLPCHIEDDHPIRSGRLPCGNSKFFWPTRIIEVHDTELDIKWYIYIYIYIYLFIYIRTYLYIYIIHVNMCICTCTYTHIHMYLCMYIYIHIYIYIYSIHIYIYIQSHVTWHFGQTIAIMEEGSASHSGSWWHFEPLGRLGHGTWVSPT